MVRMEIEELDNQAATVQKQVEIMEERRLQLEKSYEKAINLQSDIHQSIRNNSLELTQEEILDNEEILSVFSRQSRLVEEYYSEEKRQLKEEELKLRDKLDGIIQKRQLLYIENEEKIRKGELNGKS
ncbi:hypothetical protein ACFKI6_05675 [Streptococcus agalactiae]|uniref:hypothetical protein n=1 Tax=Streptococcus agalactiae TaxID=1311 RepID=UPI0002BA5C30|nr:hypothetical protein [Streptococcus agalactiae]AKI57442.1 Hypothetical Protein GBS85147_1014 [Streptococcus agalactiae]ASI66095.1 hypothetical protein GT95_05655 [Streptococcus agalactiae]EPU00543.1 hypothetical protein SAG0109_07490 [Streptococcus agalactiae BSU108]EPW72676.1 hypothetical protein SAG0101_03035 [Streptococcus agalactiae BSU451]EPW91273.1 hypothetical protein SAG0141_00110 [Streptococcus agalactiae MRI Z1-023]